MSMDVSTLAIEVKTTGIQEASNALGSKGLARSAENADKKVVKLTESLAKLMGVSNTTAGAVTGLNGAVGGIASAMVQTSAMVKATAIALSQATQQLAAMTAATNQSTAALHRKSAASGTVLTTIKAMATAFSLYAGFNFAGSVVKDADAWQLMQARLSVATGSMHNARVAQQQIYEVSQKLRQPLEATTQLYTRMAPAMARMGKSSTDTIQVVEGVGLALKLSGATAGEAASAMLQLSQSFNAGRLNGAEFNSIAEAAPKLLDAMVVELQKIPKYANVGREELKKLGSEGKITGVIMAQAIKNAAPVWQEEFKKIPVTFGDAMTRVQNAWKKAMGELGENTKFNTELAASVAVLETMIPVIRDEMVSAFITVMQWIERNRDVISEVWDQLKGVGKDVWDIVGAFGFILGQVAQTKDSFSLLGFAVFSVRLAVAGIVDGLTLAGAVVLKLGASVIENFAAPLASVPTKIISKIIDGFSWLMEMLGKGAKWAGFDDLSTGLESIAAGGRNAATFVKDIQTGFEGVGKSLDAYGNAAIQHLTDGNGAVQKLLNSQVEVTMEMQKQSGIYKENYNKNPKKATDEAAEKERANAAKKAMKEANSELSKQLDMQHELVLVYGQLSQYGLDGHKITASQKEELDIRTKLLKVTDSGARAVLEQALAESLANQAIEKMTKALRDRLESQAAYASSTDARIDSETRETEALERKVATYGLAEGAIEALSLAEERRNLTSLIEDQALPSIIAKQEALIAVLERRQRATEALGQLELGDKIEKMFNADKVMDFGNAFTSAFGKAGAAVDKVGKALDQYHKKMVKNEATRKEIDKVDPKKRFALEERLRNDELKDTLDMYGDMAGAVKGFFSEKTVAYKAFDALEKGLRLARMAMEVKEFLIKQINEKTWLGLKISSAMTAMGMDAKETAWSVSNSLTKAGFSTMAGVAKAFEQMGVYGFVGAAAILAFMGSMGFSGGGGGSMPNIPEERQKKQGTGSVFGDDEAKSESITNALEIMRDNSNIGLRHTSNMLVALRNIEMSMSGLTNAILRVSGMTTGRNFGIQEGTQSGGGFLGTGLFGSRTTTSLADTGLIMKGVLGDLIDGSGLEQYADVTRTRRSWYGRTRTSTRRETREVEESLAEHVGEVFRDINAVIEEAATSLGASSASIRATLESFVINAEVSFKDLNGQELQDALNAVFSGAADDMAEAVFPGLQEFRRVGEGYFETLTRVATSTERARDALTKMGVSMVSLNSITNKTGDVGVELVRESLMARESGAAMREILEVLDGSMDDLIDGYRTLTRLRAQLQGAGINSALSLDMIRGAGGLEGLQDSFGDFFDNFFSDSERSAMAMSNLTMEFGRIGRAVPASREAFRNLVTQLMAGDAASQELAGRVLSLSGVFAEAMDMDSQAERISEAKDVLSEAYDRESEALENVKSKMEGFAESLRNFRDSLIMGDASPLSALEKYQTALARYNDVSSRALRGDESAIADYERVASELLNFSREVNASGGAYTDDFNRVLRETEALEQFTQAQADVATESLAALREQVEHLLEINESVKTVAQALAELRIVMAGGTVPEVDGSHANGLASVPRDGYIAELHRGERVLTAAENNQYKASSYNYGSQSNEALVNELKALREEVRTLKEEQREQVGNLIASNYDANERNAQSVVAGTREAATDAAYATRTPIGLT